MIGNLITENWTKWDKVIKVGSQFVPQCHHSNVYMSHICWVVPPYLLFAKSNNERLFLCLLCSCFAMWYDLRNLIHNGLTDLNFPGCRYTKKCLRNWQRKPYRTWREWTPHYFCAFWICWWMMPSSSWTMPSGTWAGWRLSRPRGTRGLGRPSPHASGKNRRTTSFTLECLPGQAAGYLCMSLLLLWMCHKICALYICFLWHTSSEKKAVLRVHTIDVGGVEVLNILVSYIEIVVGIWDSEYTYMKEARI